MSTRKVALITGASRGLGEAMAYRFAHNDYHVIVNYRTTKEEAERVVENIRQNGGKATALQADVSVEEDVDRLITQTLALEDRIDVLLNNAGLNRDGPFLTMSVEDFTRVVDVNLLGTFLCTQKVAQTMIERQIAGNIITISASTALRGRRNGANYCAAKAGILAFTKCVAIELAPHVRVNCVLPGYMETDEVMERFALHDPAVRETLEASIPMQRIGQPDELAAMVEFLCSDKASYITGQSFFVNGGNYMG